MADSAVNTISVAVVGGGPVGLTLALFLDWHGIKSVFFNTE
jgi:2-polyprenyl-6-methoxyphenol hydroxylase-like FAD-dependent oxidoreductase